MNCYLIFCIYIALVHKHIHKYKRIAIQINTFHYSIPTVTVPDVPFHPNDKLPYIPKSGMSRDQTRIGFSNIICLVGVADVKPRETGWMKYGKYKTEDFTRISTSECF